MLPYLAEEFSLRPSDVWDMTQDELDVYSARLREIHKQRKAAQSKRR